MKLERFRLLCRHISNHDSIQQTNVALQIYRRYSDQWHDEKNTIVEDVNLIKNLEATLKYGFSWRPKKSDTSFFPIADFETVAVGQFLSPPRKQTRERLQKHLTTCAKTALNEFDATHDKLTGLLNRSAFDELLQNHLKQSTDEAESGTDELSLDLTASAVCLFALDIDFFKQVNDTHGHLYGDLVLKAFARRLESIAERLSDEIQGSVRFFCARPSGEEFLVLASGALERGDEETIAETFRLETVSDPLPNMTEWRQIAFEESLQDSMLPHVSERRITISIGFSNRSGTFDKPTSDVSYELRNEADIALYRAKQSGRNRYIRFSDILHYHGRVLEYHSDTQVLALDIGRNNNVSLGQEFHVYHPNFTGNIPYVFSDGRTQKQLGTYPKYPSARIEVFEVQADIAFAMILSVKDDHRIVNSSALEAVPIGAISHLIEGDSSTHGEQINYYREFIDSIDRNRKSGHTPKILLVSLSNSHELIELRGIAFVNRAIAYIYQELRRICAGTSTIAQVEETTIGVDVRSDNVNLRATIEQLGERVSFRYGSVVMLNCGAFDPEFYDDENINQKVRELDGTYALGACFMALRTALDRHSNIIFLDKDVVSHALYMSRREHLFDKMEDDFFLASEIHAVGWNGYNQMALKSIWLGEITNAQTYIEHATDEREAEPIAFLNKAFIYTCAEHYEMAYSLFKQYLDDTTPKIYFPAYVICVYKQYLEGKGGVSENDVLQITSDMKDYNVHVNLPMSKRELIAVHFYLKNKTK